jgi:hypothetical protein
MKLLYSVEAMISSGGKNYKGTLDFYDTKCILHNETKTHTEIVYDMKYAQFESGITQVSFLGLYTKDKAYIQVKTPTGSSPLFIVDDDKVEEMLSALKKTDDRSVKEKNNTNKTAPKPTKIAVERVKSVDNYNEKAINRFLTNPYAILGIASNSSFIEVDEALNKVKKLDRLKAVSSYKPEYELVGFEKVKRDLPMCQNALALIKELQYKWFWFDTAEACQNWQFDWYRETFESNKPETWSYNVFLAQYLALLCFDKKMEKRQDWYDVFAFYQYVVGEGHVEFLRDKLNKDQNAQFSDEDLKKDFSIYIFEPLNDILESSGIESMLSFFRSLRMDRYSAMKEYKRNFGGKIAEWFINQEKVVWEKIEGFIGTGELNQSAANTVHEAIMAYDEKVQHVYNNALAALTKEPLRSEMVKTSYSKVMRQAMILLAAGNYKAEACKYANYFYQYADKQMKLKIISTFGIETITGATDDLPELLKDIPKTEPEKPMASGDNFEDITICNNMLSLPRVDFCGLTFDRKTIGVKFWFLNRTGVELKFWLMDIKINEIYCGSTELIGTVDDGDNDFYTYELSLPEGVGYYSVNKIEFYVEIDKPANETIHDTNVVGVKCNTTKQIFSAQYS